MKFLEQIKENSVGNYRIGFDKFSEKYILEITDKIDYRYYELTEEQYALFEESPEEFDELVEKYRQQASRCKAFFFSTKWRENSPEQEKLHWKYIYIDLLLEKTKSENHGLIGMPDKKMEDPDYFPGTGHRIECYKMSHDIVIQAKYTGEMCVGVDVSF